MSPAARATTLLTAAAIWAAWVLAHYYAFPFVRPETVDGIRGVAFPYWHEATARALRSLAGVAVTLLAAWGLGRLCMGTVFGKPERDRSAVRAERFTYTLTFGLFSLAMLLSALAWLHAYRPATAAIVLVSGAGVSIALLMRWGLPTLTVRGRHEWPSGHTLLPLAGIFIALSFALVGALAPEIEHDALWYHLWLPQRWLDAGGPVDIVDEYVSLYPLAWQLLYGGATVIGGQGAAKLLHFCCLPLLASATWLLARSLFPRANAMIAAALAVMSPTIIWEATTAYVDLALALFLTLSVDALVRFERTSNRRWLVVGAVMMGAALSIKHLALLALASLALVLLARAVALRLLPGSHVRNAAMFVVIALAVPLPWYVRAIAASGNPFFPDLYAVFGARPAERWSPRTERALDGFKSRFGPARSLGTMALLPWDVAVHGARYGGTFGPAFLILVPLACCGSRLGGSARQVAAGVGVYLLLWASPISSFQLRFLVPLLPILAVFAAAGFARLTDAAGIVLGTRAPGLLMVPLAAMLLLNLPPFTRLHERDRVGLTGWLTHVPRAAPTRVVLGALSLEQYLTESVPSYAAWTFIDTTLPPSSRILTFSTGDHLYSSRSRIWSDATAAYPVTWGAPRGREIAVATAAQNMGISHVLFDKRLIDAGALAELAIHSERMRDCCLTLVWEDARYELHRLQSPTHGAFDSPGHR